MPKIRDLGINFIPETARPLEIGQGGGCGACTYSPAGGQGYGACANHSHIPATSPVSWFGFCCPDPGYGPAGCWMNSGPYTPQTSPNSTLWCCPDSGLTREAVAQLKAQLHQQIEQLEEYEKSIGPKTIEAIEAREKELKAELDDLAKRRQNLEK